MSTVFTVITDIHYADRANMRNPGRMGQMGAILLKQALRRLEDAPRYPDVIIFAGDIIDYAGKDDVTAGDRLDEIAEIMNALAVPAIAIPGNHDLSPEEFYRHIPRSAEFVEVGNVRIIPFLDPERPNWNAERLPEELAKFDRVRNGFTGQLVALQHVPLYPDKQEAPYHYLNGDEIIRKMHDSGCTLSISGHHHSGGRLVFDGKCSFTCAPALCEAPFSFASIELTDNGNAIYAIDSLQRSGSI